MLKQSRLDALADGIFAIVMTLLVIELRIPEIYQHATETELGHFLLDNLPLFISYMLSFTLLFVYWRAHHYIASVLARNLDQRLAAINAFFLMLVALVPFSTHFLGEFSYSQTAIIFYGGNMILISLTLLWMRLYIRDSQTIDDVKVDHASEVRGMMRIVMPAVMATVAIGLSFINTNWSLLLFLVAIFFNLSDSSRFVYTAFKKLNTWLNLSHAPHTKSTAKKSKRQ
jgi:uncharacterized membrane protein